MRQGLLSRIAVVGAVVLGNVLLVPAAYAASETVCSSPYLADKVAGQAWTDKGSHKVGGHTAGQDDWASCDIDSVWDADEMIDLYTGGTVYKYVDGLYSQCVVIAGKWAGVYDKYKWSWTLDLDSITGKCGWGTRPLKVRQTAKAEYKDGTVKTVNTYVTDTSL